MPVGDIRKLSIAVLVDGSYVKNDKGVEEYQPRSKKEIGDLEDLVKKSSGFDARREDQVVVTNIPFKKVDTDAEAAQPSVGEKLESFYPALKYAACWRLLSCSGTFLSAAAGEMTGARGRTERPRPAIREIPSGGVTAELQGRGAASRRFPEDTKNYTEAEVVQQMANAHARRFADLLRNWL